MTFIKSLYNQRTHPLNTLRVGNNSYLTKYNISTTSRWPLKLIVLHKGILFKNGNNLIVLFKVIVINRIPRIVVQVQVV